VNTMLRRVHGSKMEEVAGSNSKMEETEKFRRLHSTSIINAVNKSGWMRRAGHVARIQ
jgi:hypothetical protein